MFEILLSQTCLLRLAIRPIADMGPRANLNYSPDFIMLANQDTHVIGILQIKSENLEHITCDEQEGCVGINPIILYYVLRGFFCDEWSLLICCDDTDGMMRFVFMNDSRGTLINHEMNLLDRAPYPRTDLYDLELNFKAVVGIGSADFNHNLLLLSFFGSWVNVCITHNQLKLSTGNRQFILAKENGKCIIGGVEEGDQPIEFTFSLKHMAAYQDASRLSSRVWLLVPDDPEDPYVLNCPFGLLGNNMFLFLH